MLEGHLRRAYGEKTLHLGHGSGGVCGVAPLSHSTHVGIKMIRCFYHPGVQRMVLQSRGLKSVLGDFLPSKYGNPDENTEQSYLEFLGMKTVRFKDLKSGTNKQAIKSSITNKADISKENI